jgi:WD40 repeat protein
VCGSDDEAIRIWDVETGDMVGDPVVGYSSRVVSVAFSPDGRLITSGCHDGRLQIWDSNTGTSLGDLMSGGVTSVAFSMDGQRIFSGFNDGSIRVWDVNTRRPAAEQLAPQGHT